MIELFTKKTNVENHVIKDKFLPLTWTRLWRFKKMHKLEQIQYLGTSKELIFSRWLKK